MGFISSDGSEHDSSYDQKHHESNVYGRNDGGGDLGLAKEIMNAPKNLINAWAKKSADAEAAHERWKEDAETVKSVIADYCKENWQGVINTGKMFYCYEIAYALVVIAYCKKGNYEDAIRTLLHFKDLLANPEFFSENELKILNEWSAEGNHYKYKESEKKLEKMIKQTYSKAKGHEVSDDEFKQFYISFCEKEIKAKRGNPILWLDKWGNLSGKKITAEDIKRIAAGDKDLITNLLAEKKLNVGQRIGCFLALIAIVVIVFIIAARVLGF
jgi:hypothetical protein